MRVGTINRNPCATVAPSRPTDDVGRMLNLNSHSSSHSETVQVCRSSNKCDPYTTRYRYRRWHGLGKQGKPKVVYNTDVVATERVSSRAGRDNNMWLHAKAFGNLNVLQPVSVTSTSGTSATPRLNALGVSGLCALAKRYAWA